MGLCPAWPVCSASRSQASTPCGLITAEAEARDRRADHNRLPTRIIGQNCQWIVCKRNSSERRLYRDNTGGEDYPIPWYSIFPHHTLHGQSSTITTVTLMLCFSESPEKSSSSSSSKVHTTGSQKARRKEEPSELTAGNRHHYLMSSKASSTP